MGSFSCLIVYAAIFGMLLRCAAAQTMHVVGDGLGWTVPPNSSVYSNWAFGKTFTVGDILVFNFTTNLHDVVRVPQPSYDACTQDNAIGVVTTSGPANITLDSAGDHRFICTLGNHCAMGQKLAITVTSSTPGGANPPTTTPPATPTTPTPTTPQPDACAPAPSSTPHANGPTAVMNPPSGASPPDSASASASAASSFWLILLSAGIALIL